MEQSDKVREARYRGRTQGEGVGRLEDWKTWWESPVCLFVHSLYFLEVLGMKRRTTPGSAIILRIDAQSML